MFLSFPYKYAQMNNLQSLKLKLKSEKKNFSKSHILTLRQEQKK